MDQLTTAVAELGKHDWFDWMSVIAPLLLSVVAIAISIYTLYKQNQIALFNYRYDCLHRLYLVISYAEGIRGCRNVRVAQYMYNSIFDLYIDFEDPDVALQQVIAASRKMEKEVLTLKFIFPKEDEQEILLIFMAFREYVSDLVDGEINLNHRKKFYTLCKKFYRDGYKRLSKKMRL